MFSALAGHADMLMRFLTPGTASATDKAPVGFGRAAGMPPNAAQVPTAIVAAAPAADITRDLQGGFSANRAIGAVGAGRNGALDQGDIFARIVMDGLRQGLLGLTAGGSHQRFMIVEGNHIEDEIGNCRMGGPQERFRIAGAVLKLEPDQDRLLFAFDRGSNRVGGGIRQSQNRRHRSAKSQKITTGNATMFEFLLEAKGEHC